MCRRGKVQGEIPGSPYVPLCNTNHINSSFIRFSCGRLNAQQSTTRMVAINDCDFDMTAWLSANEFVCEQYESELCPKHSWKFILKTNTAFQPKADHPWTRYTGTLYKYSIYKITTVRNVYACLLNIQSLELRRIHYDLTLTYQIVFGLSVLKCQEFFKLCESSITRGHRFKLMKQQCSGYRRHFFNTRVVNIWNCLRKDVVDFSTLRCFKNSLNYVDFSRLLTFSWLRQLRR